MRRILFFLVLYLSSATVGFSQKKNISLEDIWLDHVFKIQSVPGFTAMKNGLQYTKIDRDSQSEQINVYDLASGTRQEVIFDNTRYLFQDQELHIDRYQLADDGSKVLLFTEKEPIYRRSARYRVFVFNRETGEISPVHSKKILHAQFSPIGDKVAFVSDNNLFFKNLITGETRAITTDGKKNEIINGNCDWVYEEEFSFTRAFQWSPDGKYIAFYRFDERSVPEYTLTRYDSLYPHLYTYKYPKAGEPNSIVQIKIYDLNSEQTVNVDIGNETDQYIPRIKWTKNPGKLCVYQLNRHQNHLKLLLADARTGSSEAILTEQNPYYIEINDNLRFLPDRSSLIFNSERDGRNHLYRWDWKKEQLTQLTRGDFDVDILIGVDEEKQRVYYTAARPTPLERKLYSVNFQGKKTKLLTPEKGTHQITPVSGLNFFLDKYSTLTQPPIYYLRDSDGKIIRTLEDNQELKDQMKSYTWGEIQFKKFPGAHSETDLNGWMITPPDFDTTKKYPVLMYQYSGPGSQEVTDAFPPGQYFWHQMLAQQGYIIVCVDGTGTGFRGQEFKKKTYLTLGNLESDDQIAVARYLGRQPFVDKDRIGIWGWSYGGFMSSICILKGHNVFKSAIAVAPVTNWRYYDNIYTERYMRTPAENPQGYDQNAPENMAHLLEGNFLVIHGTGDDNVHFQNQVMLVKALIKENKQFDSEFYPDKAHGISGGSTRYQLFQKMTQFLLKNL